MKTQETLPLRVTRRKEGVFKRKGSRYWQCRFWAGDALVRRSTGVITRGGAQDYLVLVKRHFEGRTV